MIDLEKAKDEFLKYTNHYDSTDIHIERKIYHSLRVMELSKKIAENAGLTKEQIDLATLIGLLHDIARFEQRRIYHTFSDRLSVDHGDLGVEILEKDNFIRKFIEEDKYDNIIKIAIRNHNKYRIEDNLGEEELLQAKIIRDTDKLDIFYEGVEMFYEAEEEKNAIEKSYISEDYFSQLLQGKQIFRKSNPTDLDKVVCLISFIFDINYDYSKKIIKEQKYIDKIFGKFNFKNEYTQEQIRQVREIVNKELV